VLKCSVPPTVGNGVFTNYNTLLIVPCSSLNAYQSHSVWGLFDDIVEDCGTAIDEYDAPDINIYATDGHIIVKGADGETVRIFDINGKSVRNSDLPSGVYIVIVGNRPAKKVLVMK